MKHVRQLLSFLMILILLCCVPAAAETTASDTAAAGMTASDTTATETSAKKDSLASEDTKSLRIIATSDLHGKFVPWDYALDQESTCGSVAQLSTAIAQYRNEHTLLVDGGDTIQDNSADLFVHSKDVHPMIQALNALNYDVCVTGNHEYNYGMDVVKKTIADLHSTFLTGNVYDKTGKPIADGCRIFDMDGVRVAVIGMVTPNITRWDAVNLAGCRVTDPLEETRKILGAIKGQYDVLVGVFHMGLENEYGLRNSGVKDILKACPEFDVMVSAHAHMQITGEMIGKTLVVQNKSMAQTMAVVDLTISFNKDKRNYNYDMFKGVNYEINIAKEPGSRIEHLTWPDGTPVKETDEFNIAVSNYRATSQLLTPGEIYEEDDMPRLVEIDVRGELGDIRAMIADYIQTVKHGVITPECSNNWKLTGFKWDEAKHAQVAQKVASGELSLPSSEDGRTSNVRSITERDIT